MTREDWNPDQYAQFAGVRLQPAIDLMNAVGSLPEGGIVDLGCGAGVMGEALSARYPSRRLIGVDSSPAMLEKAKETGAYAVLEKADIATWQPDRRPALMFSNAVLQWLPDHPRLIPRLLAGLAPGGVLAVQVPYQQAAPSSTGWRDAFAGLFKDRPLARRSEVMAPEEYFELLSPLGEARLWETEYHQHLPAAEHGHPVRLFTESTFARPYLEVLDEVERLHLTAAYEERMRQAYPLRSDGSVLFPFRRLFFTLRKP
ncbi:methyltransferase domain-containing protein [Ruegeria sp. HKCCD8929]|uniref:methyltransferase domain-containing protein n=1 Tax=Ruegeria sp. HKCCD8929 TaxID=2683006 RepID=UPI001489DFDC|nr:methyltransferase domain-containing protein [Ruegeria sp. HKCCD8929]